MKKLKVQKIENLYIRRNLNKVQKQKIKLPEQKPDTFEHQKPYNPLEDDMGNVNMKWQKVQFYPEDIEKLKKMSPDKQIEYAIMLRKQKRYKVIKEDK